MLVGPGSRAHRRRDPSRSQAFQPVRGPGCHRQAHPEDPGLRCGQGPRRFGAHQHRRDRGNSGLHGSRAGTRCQPRGHAQRPVCHRRRALSHGDRQEPLLGLGCWRHADPPDGGGATAAEPGGAQHLAWARGRDREGHGPRSRASATRLPRSSRTRSRPSTSAAVHRP